MIKEQPILFINSESRNNSFEVSSKDKDCVNLIDLLHNFNLSEVKMIENNEEKYHFTRVDINEYSNIPGLLFKFTDKLITKEINESLIRSAINTVGELALLILKENYCFIQFNHFFTTQFVYDQLLSEFQLEKEVDLSQHYYLNDSTENSIEDNEMNKEEPKEQIKEEEEHKGIEIPKANNVTIDQLKDIIKNNKYKEYQPFSVRQSKTNDLLIFKTYSNREYHVKYVCQYSIQIENDDKFQVTKRIIGYNGFILRRIIVNNCVKYLDFTTKIRLRGKGSGYKEGPNMEESSVPLELCVSSLNPFSFYKCCLEIESLLFSIYFKYSVFAQQSNLYLNHIPHQIMKNHYTVHRKFAE